MSEAGKRLIESAQQALAFAEDRAEPQTYRVHIPEEAAAPWRSGPVWRR